LASWLGRWSIALSSSNKPLVGSTLLKKRKKMIMLLKELFLKRVQASKKIVP